MPSPAPRTPCGRAFLRRERLPPCAHQSGALTPETNCVHTLGFAPPTAFPWRGYVPRLPRLRGPVAHSFYSPAGAPAASPARRGHRRRAGRGQARTRALPAAQLLREAGARAPFAPPYAHGSSRPPPIAHMNTRGRLPSAPQQRAPSPAPRAPRRPGMHPRAENSAPAHPPLLRAGGGGGRSAGGRPRDESSLRGPPARTPPAGSRSAQRHHGARARGRGADHCTLFMTTPRTPEQLARRMHPPLG
ncbi:MAG: hypothetical protein J3K34DRAFT_210605 [Monoraphidium minutum]|nr:MAG: hypothetical protein J3K34DRAFT_210605 [Monoraphidium minutum]